MHTAMTQMHMRRLLFAGGCIYYGIWIFLNSAIPFSFDYVYLVSYVAQRIYDSGFQTWIADATVDTGHPPLIPLLHATGWMLFGKSLLISHGISFILVCLTYYYYLNISSLWLTATQLLTAALLFLFFPITLAQAIYMSPDLAVSAFFLGALYYNLKGKSWLYNISLALLLLTSVRGLLLFAAFISNDLLHAAREDNRKTLYLRIAGYAAAALPCVLWNIYHYMSTGWILGGNETIWSAHREFISIGQLPIHTGALGFRLLEFGGLCIWPIVILLRKRAPAATALKPLFRIGVFALLYNGLALLPFANPISTRYLLPLFLTGLLLVTPCIAALSMQLRTGVLLFCFAAMAGNVLYIYPDRFIKAAGYSWDCTPISLIYFNLLEKQALHFIDNELNKDTNSPVYAGMPFYQSSVYTRLEPKNTNPTTAWEENSLPAEGYFVESNTMNQVTWEQKTTLEREWQLLGNFQSGRIYIRIYGRQLPPGS